MKKSLKIASYNFKRLMLNPYSIVVVIVMLIASLIFSAVYKIPTQAEYSAATYGTTTQAVYKNFTATSATDADGNALDTQNSLHAVLDEAQNILTVLSRSDSAQSGEDDYDPDLASANSILSEFQKINDELTKYALSPNDDSSTYVANNSVQEIITATQNLSDFVEDFSSLSAFESRLVFTEENFSILSQNCTKISQILSSSSVITEILDKLVAQKSLVTSTISILQNKVVWVVSADKIEEFQTSYIDAAEQKLANIMTEIETLSAKNTNNKTDVANIKSAITAYKLTCESAKEALVCQLTLLFENHFGTSTAYFAHSSCATTEELKTTIATAEYYLQDESVTYTQAQAALNFNIASYTETAYDATYTTMAVIGFFTVIFGIFCAYKLFGSDRKKGKTDVILSQNVSFSQVFVGQMLAIVLCTTFVLCVFTLSLLIWNLIFHGTLSGSILAVFNLTSAYTINPFWFLVIKIIGIELQVIFYSTITVFIMNITRKFELGFAISLAIFAVATICNIFFSSSVVWCLFPFIHADITSYLGGAISNASFLQTTLYASGNFFISLAYYLVVVVLLFSFTKQLFKKN